MKKPRKYTAQGLMLRHAREAKGLTQKELAHAMGLRSTTGYQNWELGNNAPAHRLWTLLGSELGIDVAKIYKANVADESKNIVRYSVFIPIIARLKRDIQLLESMMADPAPDMPKEKDTQYVLVKK